MTQPLDSPLVLLVEDDRDTRDMYCVALEMSGFRTTEAGTGAAARQAVRTLRPDVVVTDLTLPDTDGWELCAEFTRGDVSRRIPVIALTGRSSDEDLRRCHEAGCARVLVKPCTPEALADAITAVLAETAQRRE